MSQLPKYESPLMKQAFEYYYLLGLKGRRNHQAVAKKFKRSVRTIEAWARAFNWLERVKQRDLHYNKEIEKKTDEIVLNTMADYRKEVKKLNMIVSKQIQAMFKKIVDAEGKTHLELRFIPKNVSDAAKLIALKDKLIRLDMDLMENPIGTSTNGGVTIIVSEKYLPPDEIKEQKEKEETSGSESSD